MRFGLSGVESLDEFDTVLGARIPGSARTLESVTVFLTQLTLIRAGAAHTSLFLPFAPAAPTLSCFSLRNRRTPAGHAAESASQAPHTPQHRPSRRRPPLPRLPRHTLYPFIQPYLRALWCCTVIPPKH